MDWHTYFIKMAQLVSEKSKDRSTKVGVVAVGCDKEVRSTGYNGFPRGVCDNVEERHSRPKKYYYTEHAERNCIYHAARIGVSLKDCTLYMNWEPIPCTDCARAVIQAGITRLIGPPIIFSGKGAQWTESLVVSIEMLNEASIEMLVWLDNQLIPHKEWRKNV